MTEPDMPSLLARCVRGMRNLAIDTVRLTPIFTKRISLRCGSGVPVALEAGCAAVPPRDGDLVAVAGDDSASRQEPALEGVGGDGMVAGQASE